MINIRTLRKIQDNGGLTLKNGRPIVYKSGWQVATEGIETTDIRVAMAAIKAYGGNCGIWFSGGIWYIDYWKKQALYTDEYPLLHTTPVQLRRNGARADAESELAGYPYQLSVHYPYHRTYTARNEGRLVCIERTGASRVSGNRI